MSRFCLLENAGRLEILSPVFTYWYRLLIQTLTHYAFAILLAYANLHVHA